MQAHEYETMRKVEDCHWWYRALWDMVVRDLRPLVSARPRLKILDGGCGTGGMLDRLGRHYPSARLHGIDFSPPAVACTKARGFSQVEEANVNQLPFASASMDVIISLDVLYHAAVDQTLALAGFHRVLKTGGTLILNLPAYGVLRGRHDLAVSGVRRYQPACVRNLLLGAGFEITVLHAWNSWLFLPMLVLRQLSRRFTVVPPSAARSDLALPTAFTNRCLAPVCALDTRLNRLMRNPVGTSLYAVARRA